MNAVKSCTKKKLGKDSPYFNTFLELKLSKKQEQYIFQLRGTSKHQKGC